MRRLAAFLRIIDKTSEWTGKIVSFGIILIIGAILYTVLLRSAFHIGSSLGIITSGQLFFIFIIFGAAYVYRIKAHVNMDILYRRLSLRARSIVDLVTFAAFLLFVVVMLWMAVEMAVVGASRLRFSLWIFWPAAWPTPLLAPVGIALLLLQGLSKFVRDFVVAVTGRELA